MASRPQRPSSRPPAVSSPAPARVARSGRSGRSDWLVDADVHADLEAVDRLIREALGGERVPDWHAQVLSERAKRLRPAFLLLCARFGPRRPRTVLRRTAAALELVHEATLYHDDVVDLSRERRGEATVWHRYGERVATLAGSELLYVAADLGASLPQDARRAIARAAARLADGQGRELELVGNLDCSALVRWRVMARKTASLFVLAAELGADLSAASADDRRCLVRFAHRFGLCYQLADDLLDLFADAASLGREPGADLRDGVYTLPILGAIGSLLDRGERGRHGACTASAAVTRRQIERLRRNEDTRRGAEALLERLGGLVEALPRGRGAAVESATRSFSALCRGLAERVRSAMSMSGDHEDLGRADVPADERVEAIFEGRT